MQTTNGSQVEVEILDVEVEAFRQVADGFFEPHQRHADVFNFLGGESLFLHPPNRLPLHQFPDELHEAEYELHDGPLNLFRVRVPTGDRTRGVGGARGAAGARSAGGAGGATRAGGARSAFRTFRTSRTPGTSRTFFH